MFPNKPIKFLVLVLNICDQADCSRACSASETFAVISPAKNRNQGVLALPWYTHVTLHTAPGPGLQLHLVEYLCLYS